MAKRTLLYSFAFFGLVALGLILFPGGSRTQENAKPLWEYKVIDFEATQCAAGPLTASLNESGEGGWELVAYTRYGGEDTVLVRPAATGYGKTTVPQLADSFQGTITSGESGNCRLVLKRLLR
jgi:hypothetical protein